MLGAGLKRKFWAEAASTAVKLINKCPSSSPNGDIPDNKWMQAMLDEIGSLLKNGTWVLVERPDGRRVVSCKWIFKRKIEAADGDNVRYKVRLVARGFTQEHGIDYDAVFSPVVKHASIRILLAIVVRKD